MTSLNLSVHSHCSDSNSLPLLLEDEVLYEVELSTVETITQMSISELIQQHTAVGKSFIIAVAKGRELERPTIVHNFYFAAHQLNKTLFVESSDGIISRFHRTKPLQPTNPLTNQPFIGEIEYFAVKKNSKQGVFIGTDYTFANSETLRSYFKTNALAPIDAELPQAAESIPDFARMFEIVDINNLEIFSRMLDRQNETLLSRVHVPFRRASLFGALTIVTLLIYIAALIEAGRFYVNLRIELDPVVTSEDAIIWCIFPMASLLQDKATSFLYSSTEDRGGLVAKAVSWVLYFALFSLMMSFKNYIINSLFAIVVLGYGSFYTLYSIFLFFAYSSRKRLI